ncbi:transposase [Nocardiopsis exhalans]|uniref:Transposase n=1 Tax=Nocardiopsis exhalans TaxID=163604 RepID=A0ABY5D510_9ACTN|nr:transposase [Nocardiopsis exhalans]USY18338.1 transposase [Nocardiopsis exhalans]
MKLTVQVKLTPDAVQAPVLERTLATINEAANQVSAQAFARFGLRASIRGLRSLCYGQLKDQGFGAQVAQHIIKRVVDAYSTLRGNIRAGNLGPEGSKRRAKAKSKPIVFREHSAHTMDDRCLSWNYDSRTVSVWTLDGRMKTLSFTCSPRTLKQLVDQRQGESDLVCRGGKWFLLATIEEPEPEVFEPEDWVGVDRGIVNLATTSDGSNHQGRRLGRYRRWQARKRTELQAKRTRSAARRAKRRAKKEARYATHLNHKIAKNVVAVAQRTTRGIALEELQGIRGRVTVPRDQRARLSSWPFHQLGAFLAYKAQRAGVPLIEVDPAYTSQMCPALWCGHTGRGNRRTRDYFLCCRCGFAGPADEVAAVNVRARARRAWAFLNMPAPDPA